MYGRSLHEWVRRVELQCDLHVVSVVPFVVINLLVGLHLEVVGVQSAGRQAADLSQKLKVASIEKILWLW